MLHLIGIIIKTSKPRSIFLEGVCKNNATKLTDNQYDRVFLAGYANFAFINLFESHFLIHVSIWHGNC